MLFDPSLGRRGLPVPGVLAAKDDLGIDRLLAVVGASGAKGIVRRLLGRVRGGAVYIDFHNNTSFQLL